MTDLRIGVIGASGFVGGAVTAQLERNGIEVVRVKAPRLVATGLSADLDRLPSSAFVQQTAELASALAGAAVVVNAAGDPDASSQDAAVLLAANAALPVVGLRAAELAGATRFVHISSAVVQGDRPSLDSSTDLRPFSPYSQSKAAGERWLLAEPTPHPDLVIYRPPSVHAPGRRVTQKVAALASGPLRSVAGRGDQASPQALLGNVAAAVAFLATCKLLPPTIVHHPWEGLTSADVMRLLGGREPRHLPAPLARAATTTARWAERPVPALAANRRRVELMWFGQGVEPSWLTEAGWRPELGREAWTALAPADSAR